MMHEGNSVLDIRDQEKKNTRVEDILEIFDRISIEKGN